MSEKIELPNAEGDLSWLADALTPNEVAETLGLTYHHTLKMIHHGEIEAYRIGSRKIRVPRTALSKIVQRVTSAEEG